MSYEYEVCMLVVAMEVVCSTMDGLWGVWGVWGVEGCVGCVGVLRVVCCVREKACVLQYVCGVVSIVRV